MTSRIRYYEPGLSCTVDASHQYLLVVDLLGQGDLKTAWTTAKSAASDGAQTGATAYSRYVKIFNRPMLDKLLADVAIQSSESNNPLIVFDAHGSPDQGLLIAPTNTYIPWDKLQAALQRINERTRNRTGVIMSSCYGMRVCDGIKINQPTPFQFCIAPKAEIEAGVVEAQLPMFFRTIFETHSIDLAMRHLQPHYDFFHSHMYFYSQFLGYLRRHTQGLGRRKFIEEMTTKLLGRRPGSEDVKAARSVARTAIADTKAHFVYISDTFLHGKGTLSFEDIDKYVKKWPGK
jgi:hypothetical protein